MSETVILSQETNGVMLLTINRPAARNALNAEARSLLDEHVRAFEADPELKVLVLTGTGDASFCAGADLKEMADTAMQIPPIDFIPQFGRTHPLSKPTIAAVNGHALAGGFLLAQNCDLVFAAPEATFGITEIRWSRGAPWAIPLIDLVGPRAAMELLLTGDPISARRAQEIGFVNRVVGARRTARADPRRRAPDRWPSAAGGQGGPANGRARPALRPRRRLRSRRGDLERGVPEPGRTGGPAGLSRTPPAGVAGALSVSPMCAVKDNRRTKTKESESQWISD